MIQLLLLAGLLSAQQTAHVRRGTLDLRIKLTGTVVPDDVFRLKSTIDGRVEAVIVSTHAWAEDGQAIGYLATRELTAIVDARGSTERDILEERWQRVYKPTPIRCPGRCFVLKSYIRPKQWVKPRAVLIEAAKSLRLVGRVRPEDAHRVRDGMEFSFWPAGRPDQVHKGRVKHYVLDVQGERVEPGGTFTLELEPGRWLPPATQWEGAIVPQSKKNVLIVPTGALVRHGDEVFLPVKVSTGVTTDVLTEITAGIEPGRKVLVLDDSQLPPDAERHQPEADLEALERRMPEQKPDRAMSTVPSAVPPRRERPIDPPDPDAGYGEDPYAE